MEELGINIRFIHEHKLFPDEDSAKSLPTPFGSFAHIVSSDGKLKQSHENVILAYVVYPIGIPAAVEHQSIKWFSDNDLRGPGVHRIAAKIAIAGLKHIERKY
jgi:hypothetical protein